MLTADPVLPSQFQTQTGGVNVKGVELEAKVSVNRELDVIAGYSHLAPKITASNDGDIGKTFQNVALDTASLWAFTHSAPALGAVSGSAAASAMSAKVLPMRPMHSKCRTRRSSTRPFPMISAICAPDLKGVTARINVTNIGNRYYVTNCFGTGNCGLGIARTVLGTMSYQW